MIPGVSWIIVGVNNRNYVVGAPLHKCLPNPQWPSGQGTGLWIRRLADLKLPTGGHTSASSNSRVGSYGPNPMGPMGGWNHQTRLEPPNLDSLPDECKFEECPEVWLSNEDDYSLGPAGAKQQLAPGNSEIDPGSTSIWITNRETVC